MPDLSNVQSIELVFSPGAVHVLNQTVTFPATNITLRSATDDESKLLPSPSIICSNDLQSRLYTAVCKQVTGSCSGTGVY